VGYRACSTQAGEPRVQREKPDPAGICAGRVSEEHQAASAVKVWSLWQPSTLPRGPPPTGTLGSNGAPNQTLAQRYQSPHFPLYRIISSSVFTLLLSHSTLNSLETTPQLAQTSIPTPYPLHTPPIPYLVTTQTFTPLSRTGHPLGTSHGNNLNRCLGSA